MRKLYFFLITGFFVLLGCLNQASAQNYTYTTSNGNAIVPGTSLVPGSQADDATSNVALPFTYTAYNVNYTSVNVGTNGNLQFTTTNTAFTNTCPLPDAGMGVAFHPHWDDLNMSAGGTLGIYTSVTGSSPNRIFNIEWRAVRFGGSNPVSFEARLFEGQQRVDYTYGAVDLTGSSASIGVQNAASALQTTFSCNTSSLSSGLNVSFVLTTPCSGVPSPGFITGAPASITCAGTPVTLTLNGYTTGNGISIQWRSSATAGGPYTDIAGATNSTYTFNANTTAYYVAKVTCGPSGFSATSSEVAVSVDHPIHTVTAATPSVVCSPGASLITGTVANGVTAGGSVVLASSGTINLAVPDNTPAGVNTILVVPATSINPNSALMVRINMTHTWVGDLIFKLTSPCGVTYLFDRPGVPVSTVGNSDNLAGVYTFDLNAASVIPENASTGTIAPGSYHPSDINGASQNWAGLTFPCNAGGNWTLNISDNAGGDVGTLADWAIIGPGNGNYTHTLTGPGTIVQNTPTGPNNSNASFSVSNIPAGTQNYILTSTDVLGCSVSTTIPVTVNQTPTITLIPTSATVCNGTITQIVASVTPSTPNYTVTSSSGNSIVPGTTLVPGSQADDATSSITLPFTYQAYGSNYTTANVGTNGNIQFTTNSTTFSNVCPLPAAALGVAFHPHWDDLNMGAGGSLGIYTSVTGVSPNRIFNIEWRALRFGGSNPVSFEARLYEGQQRVDYIYGAVDLNGSSASIGVQNAGAGLQTTYSCNAASLSSGLGLSFVIPSPLVTFTPVTELYTDAGATVAYAGTAVGTIYAKPTVTRTYTASFTSVQGCVGTATVTINVNQPPAITVQPVAPAPSCPGFNVIYTVTATGAGLTYQWQVSTDGGTTYNNIVNGPLTYSGATTNSLTVINPQASMNNYRYRVVINGTCAPSVTSNAVVLGIANPPTITSLTTNPATPTICQNGNITFTVVAAGSPIAPNIYQWQVSTDGGVTWTNLTTGGSYTPVFTITGAATTLNNNRYRVIVTNSCGQSVTSSSVTLTVNPIPTVTTTPLTNRICISDTLVPLVGSPVGGSWSGPGVSGFNFIPSATGIGLFTLTYSYTSAAGCTNTSSFIVKVEDCPERVRRLKQDNAVILYPNPNNGRFNIKINSTLYNYLGMKVYDATGRTVRTQYFNSLVYGRVLPINISNLPNGVYIVKFYYDDGIRTSEKSFQVIIQK
jgi:subtilisin-like proprotein convertase family protein